MKRERPTVILVFAILNMVFGGLGLLCYFCGGAGLALVYGIATSAPPAPGMGTNPFADMMHFMEKEIPGYFAFMIAGFVAGFLMSCLLIVSGIGLLGMRPWGRWLTVGWSTLMILLQLGTLVFQIAYVNPATAHWQQDFQQRMIQRPGMPGAAPTPTMSPVFNNMMSMLGAGVSVAYAIGLLVVMFLPVVSVAFAGPPKLRDDDELDADRDEDVERY